MPVRPTHRLRDETGSVMVPVVTLLAVTIMLGLALLALTDVQTREARAQRSTDAAQAIAEGVVAATANALASTSTPTDWPTSGTCQTFTGTLATPSTAPAASLERRVADAIRAFSATSDDYDGTTYATTWRVNLCPVLGTRPATGPIDQSTERRWSEGYLARAVPAVTSSQRPPAQVSLWVRGQARVGRRGTTGQSRAKAVATKVRQGTAAFDIPLGYAVGTGSFSTELTTGLSSVTTGQLLGTILGTQPLIAENDAKIGVRCGLLNTLNNPSSVCLSGTFAGVSGVTNATGLGTLTQLLGIGRAETLPTWTMSPQDVQDAYRDSATIYKDAVAGTGDVRTKTVGAAPECFTETTDANSVVYIRQVGDGEQYCTISSTPANPKVVKVLVIERGGVRFTGPFTGVVYALNRQECGADGTCTTEERTAAPLREVVRIEGNDSTCILETGTSTPRCVQMRGGVWADGAGGAVGIYPQMQTSGAASRSVLSGICSVPVVGPLLGALNTTLTGVGNLLGQTLNLLGNVQEQIRYPGGASSADGCQALTAQLGTLTNSQLLTLFESGGTTSVPVSEHRTRTCAVAALSLGCGSWTGWTAKQRQDVTLPALVSELVSSLTQLTSRWTAIKYDEAVTRSASTVFSVGGGPVSGTYRNVPVT